MDYMLFVVLYMDVTIYYFANENYMCYMMMMFNSNFK